MQDLIDGSYSLIKAINNPDNNSLMLLLLSFIVIGKQHIIIIRLI